MSKTVEQAVAALAQANAAFQSELEADCKRTEGSGAQERRRAEYQQSLQEDIAQCERDLVEAKKANVPTIRQIQAAKAEQAKAIAATQQATVVFEAHSSVAPLKIAFREGQAAGHMKTNPENHWNDFLDYFGDVTGAREQFDAGLASTVDTTA